MGYSPYAWIIDKDHLAEAGDSGDVGHGAQQLRIAEILGTRLVVLELRRDFVLVGDDPRDGAGHAPD